MPRRGIIIILLHIVITGSVAYHMILNILKITAKTKPG